MCVCVFFFPSFPRSDEAANELAGSERPSGMSSERVVPWLQIAMQVGGERCSGSLGVPHAAILLYS